MSSFVVPPESSRSPHEPLANPDLPAAQGLYDPRNEHDSCGVNFVVDMQGRRSHKIVAQGFGALCALEHRGAIGAEPNTGDGAGMLIQVPDRYFRAVVDFDLPEAGAYVTGIGFLPADSDLAGEVRVQIEKLAESEGFTLLGWREVPTDSSMLGPGAKRTMPSFWQPFLAHGSLSGLPLERRAYVLRKRIEHEIRFDIDDDDVKVASMGGKTPTLSRVYFSSLSARTFVYKGMLTTLQLTAFYPEINDERVESALAIVHSRFSTNTFPSWSLAHPYRYVAHNGEINTVQGNRNWMRAREAFLAAPDIPGDLERIFPICTPGGSDTAGFDEALELLHLGGYPLPEAVLTMIPEPWERHETMSPELKAFYRFHAIAHGAMGRSGFHRLHRRDRRRRRPRSQRLASVALLGHRRRSRHHGLRGRRGRRAGLEDRREGSTPTRSHVPDRHERGPDRPRSTRSSRSWRRRARIANGSKPTRSSSMTWSKAFRRPSGPPATT